MIKIIKNSMVDPIDRLCPICGSIFSYNFEDIRRDEIYDILGQRKYLRYIVCPVCKCNLDLSPRVEICNTDISISREDLPRSIELKEDNQNE